VNFRKNNGFEFTAILSLSVLGLLIAIIMLGGAKRFYFNKNQPINGFYSRVIHYTMPLTQLNSVAKGEGYETGSFKETLLRSIGISSKNYMSIVGKEISYVSADLNYAKKSQNNVVEDPENAFDEFVLNDDQVYVEENKVENGIDMNSAPSFSEELKKELSSKPEVLIYHTHTCESYKPYANKYGSNVDKNKSVAAVGEQLKKELEKYGINTVHDTTIHDIETYNGSYAKSRVTLQKYLNEYKDFKLIIDLHRDSVEDKDVMTTTINGESVARFSFVMTKNHPNSEKNIQVAEKLKEISNKLYPGNKNTNSFYKRTFYYNQGRQFYSQDLNENIVLMEVGSHVNTLDEAKGSTKYLARVIAEYINGKN
jgi:stage II sporulation protein P